MRIVITGGTGFIGVPLIKSLVRNGHELIVLTRNPDAAQAIGPQSIIFIKWDGRNVDDWAKHGDGARAVINLAGEPIGDKRWTKFQKGWILNSRIEATRAIAEAIKQANAKPAVLINGSAVGFYGDVPDGDVDENTPRGKGFLAEVCEQWEAEAAQASKFDIRVAMIRTGIVLEREGGALKRMLGAFKMYTGGTPGSGRQWVPWIHREDAIRAIEFMISNDKLSGPVNLTAPNPVTMAEFAKTIGKIINRPLWVPVPAFVIKTALGEMAEMLLTGQKAVPSKLLKAGFDFHYPDIDDALSAILEEKKK
jgi:uncharacterized protein (TIGR01777 family)